MKHLNKIESIIARSPSGRAVVTFDTAEKALSWASSNPHHNVSFYKQIITEEIIDIHQTGEPRNGTED